MDWSKLRRTEPKGLSVEVVAQESVEPVVMKPVEIPINVESKTPPAMPQSPPSSINPFNPYDLVQMLAQNMDLMENNGQLKKSSSRDSVKSGDDWTMVDDEVPRHNGARPKSQEQAAALPLHSGKKTIIFLIDS